MVDAKEISGKEKCDILNSFKDYEENNREVSQQSKEKHWKFSQEEVYLMLFLGSISKLEICAVLFKGRS